MTEKTLNTVSSLFYFIPAIVAFETGKTAFAALTLVVIIVSVLYHQVKKKGPNWYIDSRRSKLEHFSHYLDTVIGIIFLGYGIWLFYTQGFPPTFYVALFAFIPLAFIWGRTNSPRYAIRHASWHLGTALMAILPLL